MGDLYWKLMSGSETFFSGTETYRSKLRENVIRRLAEGQHPSDGLLSGVDPWVPTMGGSHTFHGAITGRCGGVHGKSSAGLCFRTFTEANVICININKQFKSPQYALLFKEFCSLLTVTFSFLMRSLQHGHSSFENTTMWRLVLLVSFLCNTASQAVVHLTMLVNSFCSELTEVMADVTPVTPNVRRPFSMFLCISMGMPYRNAIGDYNAVARGGQRRKYFRHPQHTM